VTVRGGGRNRNDKEEESYGAHETNELKKSLVAVSEHGIPFETKNHGHEGGVETTHKESADAHFIGYF